MAGPSRKALTIWGAAIALIVILLLAFGGGSIKDEETEVVAASGITLSYWFTQPVGQASNLHFGPGFDVAANGDPVLETDTALVELQKSGASLTTEDYAKVHPESFAFDQGTTLLAIQDGYLGELDDQGIAKAVPLPSADLRLAGSRHAGTVYLFGSSLADQSRVYGIYENGTLETIAALPKAIRWVTDSDSGIYVATDHEVFRVTKDDMRVVMGFQDDDPEITSIAVTPDDSALYIAMASRVYALRGIGAVAILKGIGGELRLNQGRLYVWDSARQLLLTATGSRFGLGDGG